MAHSQLRDHDVEQLRRAESRHARRIRDKQKARDYLHWLEHLREDDADDADDGGQ